MHVTLDSVVILMFGIIFIVFSEVVGREMDDFLNRFSPMRRNARRTRVICIIVGTWFVISAAWSMFIT